MLLLWTGMMGMKQHTWLIQNVDYHSSLYQVTQ